jgi:cytoskeletal protein CcmA (bactofilin family)
MACGSSVLRRRQNMATTDRDPSLSGSTAASQNPARPLLRAAYVTAVGRHIRVQGHLTATEHVIIEGVFEGDIVVPDHGVAIGGAGHLRGDLSARAITVLGRVDGNLTASALIELRSTAVVAGRLVSPRLSIEEGARFQGTVDAGKTIAAGRQRLSQAGAASPE